MANYSLRNGELEVSMKSCGAELVGIHDVKNGNNYLWEANPEFWARTSPVLFPLVGSLRNKEYSYHGKVYPMNQHGFARDLKFDCTKKTESEIWFSLKATEETKKVYPFLFHLELGYSLIGRTVKVMWRVTNEGEDEMYFSIGAHPAFVCPVIPGTNRDEYFIEFEEQKPLTYRRLNENGLMEDKEYLLETDQGIIPFDAELFGKDALIFENNQVKKISILEPNKTPYVTVSFDAPLFGLWTPAHKKAPFLCIEPWYGRCDRAEFDGTLESREWGNHIAPGDVFEASYTIEIG